MDPIYNPFTPGAGSPPPELVGRDPILEQARILLGRIRFKRPEKSMLLTGLRGVGKTVLLNELEKSAENSGYKTLLIEVHEDKLLPALIVQPLRRLLFDLDRGAGLSSKVKKGLAVLRSFIGTFNITIGEVTLGIEPEKGLADSGDLEMDLTDLFVVIGEAAEDRGCAIALLLDEIQYISQNELAALISAMHRVQQRRLPLVLIGAGLPILPGLAGESKSYAERLFSFPSIGALSEEDTFKALTEPVLQASVIFEQEALNEIYRLTKGYPYFLQEWGYQSWNLAKTKKISLEVVKEATSKVIPKLDQSFFRVRFDRLTPSEKKFLRAMAELGSGPHRIGDIADLLNCKAPSLSLVRSKLIKKGMIYSPAYGDLAFTVPLFDEFMIRAMPTFQKTDLVEV